MTREEFVEKAQELGYDEDFCDIVDEKLAQLKSMGVDKTYDDVLLTQQTNEDDGDEDKFSESPKSLVVIR